MLPHTSKPAWLRDVKPIANVIMLNVIFYIQKEMPILKKKDDAVTKMVLAFKIKPATWSNIIFTKNKIIS